MTQVKNVLLIVYEEKREKKLQNRRKNAFFANFVSQKHRFWTPSVQLPLFRHLARLSTLSGCATAYEPDLVGKSGPLTFWALRPLGRGRDQLFFSESRYTSLDTSPDVI